MQSLPHAGEELLSFAVLVHREVAVALAFAAPMGFTPALLVPVVAWGAFERQRRELVLDRREVEPKELLLVQLAHFGCLPYGRPASRSS